MGKSGGKSRPSTTPRETRKTIEKADANLEAGMVVTFEGDDYEVRVGDMTPALTRELRRATGFSFMQLLAQMAVNPDVDSVAAWVWLAKRVDGETVALSEIDERVTYASIQADDDFIAKEVEVGDTRPEA